MEMTDRVEITVAVISGAVGTTDGALSLTNSDPSSLTIVSTTGQIIANVAGISPIGAYVTAPGAALVTLYKVTVVQPGRASWDRMLYIHSPRTQQHSRSVAVKLI